tara:strand:- start:314 stop:727 length:414 start_codon:yes stop_codon:yes gene_type:complete
MSINNNQIFDNIINLLYDLTKEDLDVFLGGGDNTSSESSMNLEKSKELYNLQKLLTLLLVNLATTLIYGLIYYITRGNDNFNELDNNSTLMDCLYFSFSKTSMVINCDISAKSGMGKLLVMTQQILILSEIVAIFML